MIKYEGKAVRIKEMTEELKHISYNNLVKISTPQKKQRYKGFVDGKSSYEEIIIWGRAMYYDLYWLKTRNKRLGEFYIKELTIRLSYSNSFEVCINAQKKPCSLIINFDERGAYNLRKQANHFDLIKNHLEQSSYKKTEEGY